MRLAARSTLAAVLMLCCPLWAQGPERVGGVDSDGDGLSDALEQRLLEQFAPAFLVGREDCSKVPAEFWRDELTPRVRAENGTIYGQAFPAASSRAARPRVEVHYYHLWRTDCGPHGHPLDTEHVAALVEGRASEGGQPRGRRCTGMRRRTRTRCAT